MITGERPALQRGARLWPRLRGEHDRRHGTGGASPVDEVVVARDCERPRRNGERRAVRSRSHPVGAGPEEEEVPVDVDGHIRRDVDECPAHGEVIRFGDAVCRDRELSDPGAGVEEIDRLDDDGSFESGSAVNAGEDGEEFYRHGHDLAGVLERFSAAQESGTARVRRVRE